MAKRNGATKTNSKKNSDRQTQKAAAIATLAKRKKPALAAGVEKNGRKAPLFSAPMLASSTQRIPASHESVRTRPVAEQAQQRGIEAQPSAFVDRGKPLPDDYGLDRLVALARDPRWIYCYWELRGAILAHICEQRGKLFVDRCAWVMRTHRIHEGIAVDVEIDPATGNWYLNVAANGTYQLELGLLSPEGEWVGLLASRVVRTPRGAPSDIVDVEWGILANENETLQDALDLSNSGVRGHSGLLGAARVQSSFALASSMMMGASGGRAASMFTGRSESAARENLPSIQASKSQQQHFSVKLPRTLSNVPLPTPTWPPEERQHAEPKRALAIEKALV